MVSSLELIYGILIVNICVIVCAREVRDVDRCNPTPCGVNTKCRIRDGRPVCRCITTMYTGHPLEGCRLKTKEELDPEHTEDPCLDACAAFATCEVQSDNTPDCKCQADFVGDGFAICTPECSSHSECPANRACIGFKCGDPCDKSLNFCGKNAECRVNSAHKAVCKCPKGWRGHPFQECFPRA